jgi:type I restriction enzyme S subunit
VSWPLVPVSDFCQTGSGGTPSRNQPEFYEGSIPWIKSGDLKEKIVEQATEFISDLAIQKSSAKMIPKGAILLAMYGATVGRMAMLGIDATTNQAVCSIVPDKSKAFPKYVYYALLSKVPEFLRNAVGGAQPNISQGIIKETKIPLPPLAEQKRIAAILDKADAIRRKRQQAIQLADDFLRAVFLDMFGDPVTNPKGWEIKSMKNLIAIQGGYAFKSGDFGKEGIPVVKIGNANKLGFTTKGIAFIKPENPSSLKKYELYVGDLLMSLTGTVGKDDYANVTEVTNEYQMYYLNQRVAKITVDENEISKNYLKFFLAEPQIKGEITKNNRGVRQANIGNADIYGLNVPVPSKDTLSKFDCIVKQVINMNVKSDQAPEYSNSFFNSLSQKAFGGEL